MNVCRFHLLRPSIDDNMCGDMQNGLKLEVEGFPSFGVASEESGGKGKGEGDGGKDGKVPNSDDRCRSIVDLKFVTGDDNDSIVVATQVWSQIQFFLLLKHSGKSHATIVSILLRRIICKGMNCHKL